MSVWETVFETGFFAGINAVIAIDAAGGIDFHIFEIDAVGFAIP